MQKEWNGNLKDIDAVVMFTQSNWFTEPVSNRYHYATRFGKNVKVIFIQPDMVKGDWYTEPTEFDNIIVLHVLTYYSKIQGKQLDSALLSLKIVNPILWVYNFYFAEYIEKYDAPLKIFHATEDYLAWETVKKKEKSYISHLLSAVDIVVAVSQIVLDNYNSLGIKSYKALLLENGVDYSFWHLTEEELLEIRNEKVLIYQGGINFRIDFALLDYIAKSLPDWKILTCGKMNEESEQVFKNLIEENKNIDYLGFLNIEETRELCLKASVGIIPFDASLPYIYNSFPLKAFEYMAAGLSIVSVPIASLEKYSSYIHIADTAEKFVKEIQRAYEERSLEDLKGKLGYAKTRDYDSNFLTLISFIKNFSLNGNKSSCKKINILYDEASMKVFTIKNYLEMFSRYSHHEIVYTAATGNAPCKKNELEKYDVVIIFYSIRVCFKGHLSPSFEKALANYKGHTILMLQDDYDNTEETRRAIKKLKVNTVLTVVPEKYIDAVYPQKRFPNVNFYSLMTGYISDEMKNYPNKLRISDRPILIGYRARELGYWYGNLAREKLQIGVEMRRICDERGLDVDIEWESDKRIYTEQWLDWVSSCKAVLGTESGANIFDDYGELKRKVEKKLEKNPNITYEEIFDTYLKPYEGIVRMNQVSPKMFEAISLKTALILFEGEYSGVLKAGVHYIPLKKDFSNVDEVLEKVQDSDYLQVLVDAAYKDIMSNYQLSYQWLIGFIDKCIDSEYLLLIFDEKEFIYKIPRKIWHAVKKIKRKVCR